MRFEVVMNYYFHNAKMSLARNLQLPALGGPGPLASGGDRRGAVYAPIRRLPGGGIEEVALR